MDKVLHLAPCYRRHTTLKDEDKTMQFCLRLCRWFSVDKYNMYQHIICPSENNASLHDIRYIN